MSYKGQFAAGDTVDFKFTTRRPSTGVPYTLAGTPAVRVYKANDTAQSTAGVSLTVDFDSVTGLNHVRITTASDGTFYANGSQFDVVLEAGTVDGVSVVGECIGRFNLAVIAANVTEWGGQAAQVSETNLPLVTLRNFVDHDDGVATRGLIAPGDVDLLTIESGAITANERLDVFLSSRASQVSVDALPTASANAAAVLAAGDVDGYSLEQTLKLCLAALAGKLSGAATSTITIRAADDSKNRITASVDQNGNRLLVTLDPAG